MKSIIKAARIVILMASGSISDVNIAQVSISYHHFQKDCIGSWVLIGKALRGENAHTEIIYGMKISGIFTKSYIWGEKGVLSIFFPVKCYFQYPIVNVWVLHYKSCQTYWCCSKTKRDSSALLLKVWSRPAAVIFPRACLECKLVDQRPDTGTQKSAFGEDPKLVKNRRDWKALFRSWLRISTFFPFCLELFIL